MNYDATDEINDEALAWVVRVRDRDFSAWEELEQWLGAAAAHLHAYQQISMEDRRLDPLLTRDVAVPAQRRETPSDWRRRRYLGGAAVALAAAVVALVSVPLPRSDSRYQLNTTAGERRQLVLESGTVVRLNGGTKLTLDHDNPRFAALDQGEVLFEVRHDPARPFTVQLDDARLVDLGTRFNVVRSADRTDVEVAEGAVRYDTAGERISLAAGQRLRIDRSSGTAVRSSVAPAQVGTWLQGRFAYSGDPMSKVAADLARYAGTAVRIDPGLADEPFTGVISVADPKDLTPLAPLFHAQVLRERDHWRITRS